MLKGMANQIIYGLNFPYFVLVRSDIIPTRGSETASHILAAIIIVPAAAAEIP